MVVTPRIELCTFRGWEERMKAQRNFYDIEEGVTRLENATMRTQWLNHPQG